MRKFTTRRRLAALSVVGVGALALTACGPTVAGGDGGGASESAAPGTDFSSIEPADTITLWSNHPGGSIEVERALADAFTEETGIEVEIVTAGANYEEVSQRFQTAQTSNDIGDVVVVSDVTWFTNYINGSLLAVDDVLEAAEADTTTYQEALYSDYLYEEQHYAVPYARSTPIFYYNKDAYEAAGLPDEAPTTWEEVQANAEAIVEADAASSGFSYPPGSEYASWTLANLVWGYGGAYSEDWDFAPLASAETVEALTFAQQSVQDGWANVSSGDPAEDFSAGATGQIIASTGSLVGITESADFEVGTGFLPGGPVEAEQVVPTGGAGLAIASKSSPERQLAAAMFIDFMTSTESTATFSEATGYLPVRSDADMSAVYTENPNFEVAVNQLERARSQDFARVLLPGGDVVIAGMLQEVLTTDADVAEATQAASEELTSLYESDLADELEN